jgi:hypothetical protein
VFDGRRNACPGELVTIDINENWNQLGRYFAHFAAKKKTQLSSKIVGDTTQIIRV